jgi:sugar lactone lactonase YvrE
MPSILKVLAATLLSGTSLAATLPEVTIDDTLVFPESLAAARDGTLFVGSWKGTVYRALPRQTKAVPWVTASPDNGLLSILGVLVDDRAGLLWVCSVPAPSREPPAPGTSTLMAFDLRTAQRKLNLGLPAPAAVCNDITLSKDDTAYVSDTPNGRIYTVKRGSASLELFAEDARLKGIDGIVFSGDGTLYVNSVTTNKLWRVGIGKDGKAGPITELKVSQPLQGADGFRLIGGNRFLLAENGDGQVDEVDVAGETATVKVLKDGLMTPTSAIRVGRTIYAVERKIDYVRKPELKGQDPGPFTVRAMPLPTP